MVCREGNSLDCYTLTLKSEFILWDILMGARNSGNEGLVPVQNLHPPAKSGRLGNFTSGSCLECLRSALAETTPARRITRRGHYGVESGQCYY